MLSGEARDEIPEIACHLGPSWRVGWEIWIGNDHGQIEIGMLVQARRNIGARRRDSNHVVLGLQKGKRLLKKSSMSLRHRSKFHARAYPWAKRAIIKPTLMDWLIQILLERLLQFRPRIRKDGNVLIAASPWRALILSLGFGGRMVTIDPVRKIVRVRVRTFWFYTTSHLYPFDRVLYVLSGYRDWSLSNLSITGSYRDRGVFTVELRLTTGERIVLFRFYHEGPFVNDGFMPDFMYWGDYLDASLTQGNQGRESEVFAKLVAGLLAKPIHSD